MIHINSGSIPPNTYTHEISINEDPMLVWVYVQRGMFVYYHLYKISSIELCTGILLTIIVYADILYS